MFSVLQHLSISNGNIQVDASFMQTLWNVHPTCSGSNVEEGGSLSYRVVKVVGIVQWYTQLSSLLIGYLLGGHVMRLFHGHDEVLTIPGSEHSDEQQR